MISRSVPTPGPSARAWVVFFAALLLVLVVPPGPVNYAAATWTSEYTVASGSIISENRVAVDGDNIYVVFTMWAEGDLNVYLELFDGRMWSTMMNVDASATNARFPAVCAEDGVAHIAYSDSTDGDIDIKYVSYDGESISKPVQISDPGFGKNANYPEIAVDDGDVHIVWEEWTGGRSIYHRSLEGKSWGSITEVSTDDHGEDQKNPDVAASGGRVHVVWEDGADGDMDIYYRSAVDDEWSMEVEVSSDAASENQQNPTVAAFGDMAYVAFDHLGTSPVSAVHVATYDGTWSAPVRVSGGGAPSFDGEAQLAAEDGHVAMVYKRTTGASQDVHFMHFNGNAWLPDEELSDGVATTEHIVPDVDLGDGTAHVVWHDYTGTAKLLRYRSADLGPLEPSAEVLDISPYWMDASSASLAWAAQDDYSVRRVTIEHRHSEDGTTWGTWKTTTTVEDLWGPEVSGTLEFTSPDGDGFYEFRAAATDAGGLTSPAPEVADAEGAVDTTPPTGSIAINGDDELTDDPSVTLTLTYEDATSGVSKVRFSDEAIGGDEPWEDPVSTKAWVLDGGSGVRTVHYQVLDVAGRVSEVYSDDIILDTEPPTGTIGIDGEPLAVNQVEVNLRLTYDDIGSGVEAVRLSNDGNWDSEEWMEPTPFKTWSLVPGDGEKTVHYQVMDSVGLLSQTYAVTVRLDTENPFVESSRPDDGAKRVKVGTDLVVRFSKPMDRASVEVAFALSYKQGGATKEVGGTFDWSPDGRSLTFNPMGNLEEGTEYTLSIASSAKDASGNELYPAIDHSFTTEGEDGDGDEGGGSWLAAILVAVVLIVILALAFQRMKREQVAGRQGPDSGVAEEDLGKGDGDPHEDPSDPLQ